MRICIIGNPNSIHIHRWIKYFMSPDNEVYLIGVNPLQKMLPKLSGFCDLTEHTNFRKLRYLIWPQVAKKYLQKIKPDILHAHQVSNAGWIGAATGFHPFIVTSWGSDLLLGPQRSTLQRLLAKWVLRRADTVTCVSNQLAQAVAELDIPADKTIVAPWGIDTSIYFPATAEQKSVLKSKHNLAADVPVVLSIRAMQDTYKPLVIAEAIPKVLAQISPVHFIVRTYNANESLLEQFQQIIESHGVADFVQYVGDLPDENSIADLYRLADIAISIPISDGTPSSVFEAMACGCVPILSDLPALRQWVSHEKEALFVPIGSSDELVQTLVDLLSNDLLRKSMCDCTIEFVHTQMDSQMLMKHNLGIYQTQFSPSENMINVSV